MRRKIAKRKRREILSRGAEIVSEEWFREKRRKDTCFRAEVNYRGYSIGAIGRDELESYSAVLWCINDVRGWQTNDDMLL